MTMLSKQEARAWDLPHLREAHQVPGIRANQENGDFYSVKFYPYTEPGVDPVFAVVGGKFILIGKPPTDIGGTTEYIQQIVNEGDDGEEDHITCAWSKDLETGAPWLIVGGRYGKIQIINALTGELLRTLIGHGAEIEDMAISPINPYILASASEDSTVRIWSLDPAHAKQPCAAIIGGDGHRSEILTIAFHSNGRYLLSAGNDRVINLWTLPLFPDKNTGKENPTRIQYPHFSTSDISWDPIDCVAFHGDLVLAKSANDTPITLFRITGFSSHHPPPPPSAAPTTHDLTRTTRSSFLSSAVIKTSSARLHTSYPFTILLTFKTPDSTTLFARFSLFPGNENSGPILAFCNDSSKMLFWDLDRIASFYNWNDAYPWQQFAGPDQSIPQLQPQPDDTTRPKYLVPFQRRTRGGGVSSGRGAFSRIARDRDRGHSPAESVDTTNSQSNVNTEVAHSKEKVDWEKSREGWEGKYEIRDAFREVEAHREEAVKGIGFTGRQVAWSNDGVWCVVCGSSGVIALWKRG